MVNPEVLAIVPARGGSKSIPGKNIKLLHGIPLLAYSIAAGLQAKSVSRVIVSTDDKDIAQVARKWGAEVPFLRPAKLALDDSRDFGLFQHALKFLKEKENYEPEVVVQLRPTSPFRPKDCVDEAVKILLSHNDADSVRGVVSSGQNPYKMWTINKKGYLNPLLDLSGVSEPFNEPRQHLPDTFWQTGHVDAIRVATIVKKSSLSGKRIYPLILDPKYVIDIDTQLHWNWAEWVMDNLNLPIVRPRN